MRKLLVLLPLILCAWPAVNLGGGGTAGGGGGSAPAFRSDSFAEATDGLNTLSVAYPTGCTTGDWVGVSFSIDGNSNEDAVVDDTGAGSVFARVVDLSGNGNSFSYHHRQLTGSESGDIEATWVGTPTEPMKLHAICISGAATATTPTEASGAASPADPAAITTTAADSVVVVSCGFDDGRSWDAPPSGYTGVLDSTGVNTGWSGLSVAYRVISAAGSNDPDAVTIDTAADWKCATASYED